MRGFIKLFCCVLAVLCALTGCVKKPVSGTEKTGWSCVQFNPSAFSDEGCYYWVDSSFLYFMDTSRGISVCLCTKVGCLHEKEEDVEKQPLCEAYVFGGFIMPMWFWNDHLYYVHDDGYGPRVYRRDATGLNCQSLTALGAKYIKEKRNVQVTEYILQDQYLYYLASVDPAVPDEEGLAEFSYIGRIDLAANKDEELMTGNLYLFPCAANQDGLLFKTNDTPRVDYNDPNYRDQLQNAKTELKYWDSKTGEISTVFSSAFRDFSDATVAAGDKVYYFRGSDSCTMEYDMKTGVHREIATRIRHINGHYALHHEENSYTLYDLQSGKQLPVKLKADSISVHSVSENAVILKISKLHPDGNRMESSTYCYVTLAALADGLQERDIMELYTNYYKEPATSMDDLK